MFNKVLIANRGETALRVARTVQQMGAAAIEVYSDPDRTSPHLAAVDEAYPLEGSTSAETYLRGDRIIDIARRHRADAIHPGYDFLSENAAFAEACARAGITFIGPSPEMIRAMGATRGFKWVQPLGPAKADPFGRFFDPPGLTPGPFTGKLFPLHVCGIHPAASEDNSDEDTFEKV